MIVKIDIKTKVLLVYRVGSGISFSLSEFKKNFLFIDKHRVFWRTLSYVSDVLILIAVETYLVMIIAIMYWLCLIL